MRHSVYGPLQLFVVALAFWSPHAAALMEDAYSDGSTEIFIYASIYSQHKPKSDSFKPGDGVPGSACIG